MNKIRIIPDSIYQGEGISKGLARGLLVYYGDRTLPARGWVSGVSRSGTLNARIFPGPGRTHQKREFIKRTFTLDTRMRWGIRGKPSDLLTRLIESGISAYMQFPGSRGLSCCRYLALRTLLGIHPLFETIPSRGKVTFSYRVTGNNVEVQVEIITPVMPQDTLCLLNELSAAWFTAGWDGERPVSPPPGWEKVEL